MNTPQLHRCFCSEFLIRVSSLAHLLLATLLLLPGLVHSQSSQVPNRLSYQGLVTDIAGVPLGNTTPENHEVIFRLWDGPTAAGAANLVYSEKQVVTIANGEFSVLIGAGADVSGEEDKGPGTVNVSDAFDGSQRFLGVTVAAAAAPGGITGSDLEITPRQQLVSTAFSFRAKEAESVINDSVGTSSIADGAITLLKMGSESVNGTSIVDNSITSVDLANGAVSASKLASDVGFWSVGGANVYRPSGSVGIGTASPTVPLHVRANSTAVAGDSGLTIEQAGAGDAALSLLISNTARYNIGIDNSDGDKLKIFSDSVNVFGGSGITMDVSGRVGIGTETPSGRLHVKDTMLDVYTSVGTAPEGGWARDGLTVASNPGAGFSTMVIASAHDAVADRGILNVKRGELSYFYVRTDGNVGIAEPNPAQAKLVVNGSVTSQPHGGTYGYLSATGAVGNGTSAAQATSIYATNTIWAGTFVIASSDERIKLIQRRSDGMKDLATLQGLEITDYQYKDVIAKGDGLQKKLIAQQVEKVFPQAVSKRTDTVPDIYRKASLKEGWIALTTDLKKGERVRLIGEDHDAIHEVTEVAKDGFRTDYRPDFGTDEPANASTAGKNAAGEVFVFGREVDDFRTVDYDAISMLNVSATQQIKKEKDAEVKALRDENAELRVRVAALEARDKERDGKLASIETLLKSMSKPPVQTASLNAAAE